jgi:hypothetical protein
VARRCEYHPAYQWLTGCEVVNYHTLSDFRVDHQEALDKLFAPLLAILSSEGLITLEQVVHDGTKVKAAAYVAKMQTEEARAAYGRRGPVAEFSNLWLKAKLGLRQFCVRGLKKARCEVLWACLTYNIQQWFRLRWKPRLTAASA